jgi:hypothetical protein
VKVYYEPATIANCELRNNAGSGGLSDGLGGAIWAEDATVDIRDNYIWGNTATLGGAMYLLDCSGVISNNTISGNTVSTVIQPPYGGGIYLTGCADLVLSGNTIAGNTGAQSGGGVYAQNSSNVSVDGGFISNNAASFQGGGVAAINSQVGFTSVEFDHNNAAIGGGVAADDTSTVDITECRFLWNTALIGGGVYAAAGGADVTYNLFVGNDATSSAGAFFLSSMSSGVIAGNTLDRNSSASGAGGMVLSSCDIEVFNNIVSNSTGYGFSCTGSPYPSPSYNVVWNSSGGDYDGCSPGVGSISADPLYVDTAVVDYHLAVHSPAIDAGRPGATYEDPDGSRGDIGRYGSHAFTMERPSYTKGLSVDVEVGNVILRWNKNPEDDIDRYAVYRDSTSGFIPSASNFVMFTAAGDTSANLGAPEDTSYYRVSAVDTSGYAGGYSDQEMLDPATGAGENVVYYKNRLYQNVPNPFNPATLIRYELGERAEVTLVVYDVAGRRVRSLVSARQARGVYMIDWNGTNDQGARVSSGLYFYRLQAGAFVQTCKMILLK